MTAIILHYNDLHKIQNIEIGISDYTPMALSLRLIRYITNDTVCIHLLYYG